MRKFLKNIVPDFAVFLYKGYRDFKKNKESLKKIKNLRADATVSVRGTCAFEEGVRAGKNVIFSNVRIGKGSYFSGNNAITNATIGRFCSIATNVKVGLGTHPSKTFVTTSPAFYLRREKFPLQYADKDYAEEFRYTTIGNDVWIGENALIKDGISIGNGVIIGAGAVVVKDVEPYSVVGGVPARLIKYRFTKEEILFLEKIKWWNASEQWLKDNWRDFLDIERFIEKHRTDPGQDA